MRPTKVIFSECHLPFWVDVAANLARDHDWQPCYWIAVPHLMREPVTKRFPDVVFHSTWDALRTIPPPECATLRPAPIDQPLLRSLAFHESIVLEMMERMDPGDAFGHEERVRHYRRLLMYWLAVLDRFDPHVVVFPTTPHVVYDYVLYALCLHRGVRTLMFEPTYVEGLVFPLERLEEGCPEIQTTYRRLIAEERSAVLTAAGEAHWARISAPYSAAIPFYLKEKIDQITDWRDRGTVTPMLQKLTTLKHYPRYCASVLRRARRWTFPPAALNYLKEKGKSMELSDMSGRAFREYRRGADKKKKHLAAYYQDLTELVTFDRPYVFVALHYQPEKTTSPGGGVFADQTLMVDLLSKALPAGWQLYVKEHPAQLAPFWKGELARTEGFYDDIAALPNVKMVSLSVSPFDLIDRSQAVATVAGTVGWESVVRGKPVLAFGHPWYAGCEGVFYVPSFEQCRNVLARISEGYRVDREKVRLFLETLERVCFRGYVDPDNARVAGVSVDDNVRVFTRVLAELIASGARSAGEQIAVAQAFRPASARQT